MKLFAFCFCLVVTVGNTLYSQTPSTVFAFDLRGGPANERILFAPVDDLSQQTDIDGDSQIITRAFDFTNSGELVAIERRFFQSTSSTTRFVGTIDLETGAFTQTAVLGGAITIDDFENGMSIDPTNDQIYVCTDTDLFTLNAATGEATLIGPFLTGGQPVGTIIEIAIDNNGQMFAHDIDSDSLFSVDKTTGDSDLIGGSGVDARFSQGMDFDPATNLLYAAIYTGFGNGSYGSWDTVTGEFVEINNFDEFANESELVIAIQPAPVVPTTTADSVNVFRGIQLSGNLADSFESDDDRLTFNPGFVINSSEAPVWLIFDSALPSAPTTLAIQAEMNAGTPGIENTLEAFNWSTNAYDVVDVSPTSFNSDSVITADLSAGIANYVGPVNEVRARIGWRAGGFIINFPWEVRLDQLVWAGQ